MQIELASTEGEGGGVDEAAPCEEEVARVVQVVAASAQPKYWVSASMDGNGEKHYRGEQFPRLAQPCASTLLPRSVSRPWVMQPAFPLRCQAHVTASFALLPTHSLLS